METPRSPFLWHCFDLRPELPSAWDSELQALADEANARTLVPASVTSREAADVAEVPVLTVGGVTLRERIPWLYDLYLTRFRELGERVAREPVSAASDDRYAINLNVQRGTKMRYECHVDSNPLECLLYVTTHPPGAGGELVVANGGDVAGVSEIDADATRIYPVAGNLVFFDARAHSHYVAPLARDSDTRLVVAMNYYTDECPESERPADLNRHLFGTD